LIVEETGGEPHRADAVQQEVNGEVLVLRQGAAQADRDVVVACQFTSRFVLRPTEKSVYVKTLQVSAPICALACEAAIFHRFAL
jgi:hypothetical protein